MLKGVAPLALSVLAPKTARSEITASRSPGAREPGGILGYAFNAKTQDVTLFDPRTLQVLATKPLGAVVRWLSNEQRFWDGRHIWTYDFPDDTVQAIAVDLQTVSVARTLPTTGSGPAHSLMLTPDRKTAWLNIAGGDYLAVLDLDSEDIVAEVATGAFP